MSKVEVIRGEVAREIERIIYGNLTPKEFGKSNYSDSVFQGVFMEGIHDPTGYKYFVSLLTGDSRPPELFVRSEKRGDYLSLGSEERAESALREVALAMRTRTGGHFDIHPFYGAVYGTQNSPIIDHIMGGEDDNLSMTAYLIEDGSCGRGLTKEGISGQVIESFLRSPHEGLSACIDRATRRSPGEHPNVDHRRTAVLNDLGVQWDREFERYNSEEDVRRVMEVTQESALDFMGFLEGELKFRDLVITRTNYGGLTLDDFSKSTLPKRKVIKAVDSHYNEISLDP